MGKIIAIANQKGGVGKSTITFNLAGAFSKIGDRVLVIDLDQQANLTSAFSKNVTDQAEPTVSDLFLQKDDSVLNLIVATSFPSIDLIRANAALGILDFQLAADLDAQYRLADALQIVRRKYNAILLDCPPSLGIATRAALIAANSVLIPLEAQEWSQLACDLFLDVIDHIKKRVNKKLKIAGYIINKFNTRRAISEENRQQILSLYNPVFNYYIKDSSKYQQSIKRRKPVVYLASTSEESKVFLQLAEDLK